MKFIALIAVLATLSAPAFANTDVIAKFNQSKEGGDVIVSTTPATRGDAAHSATAQAIFDRIQAANAEDE
ncbi:hypothetical protein [Jannaschia marina]|uniref:hypothetical protein n=1 Tax=Jannaschia marina TaxID=2741674 RepID=UPI0015C71C12|nr:hypothetical protein [Jannaschia marina]